MLEPDSRPAAVPPATAQLADRPIPALAAPEPPSWTRSWKVMLVLWAIMLGLAWMALRYDVDRHVIAATVVVVGVLTNAFAWLIGIVALVPIIGPLVVKVLSIGFIWLLNAIGYLVSIVAIRRGYSKDVLTYRGMTVALIIGIVIGFVLCRLL